MDRWGFSAGRKANTAAWGNKSAASAVVVPSARWGPSQECTAQLPRDRAPSLVAVVLSRSPYADQIEVWPGSPRQQLRPSDAIFPATRPADALRHNATKPQPPGWVVGSSLQLFFSTCTISRRLAAPLPSPLFGPYSHWVQIFPCIFWGCSGHAFHFGGDFFYLHPALVEDPIIPCPSPLVPAAIGPPTGDTGTVAPPTLPSKAPTAPLMGRLKMLGVIA